MKGKYQMNVFVLFSWSM